MDTSVKTQAPAPTFAPAEGRARAPNLPEATPPSRSRFGGRVVNPAKAGLALAGLGVAWHVVRVVLVVRLGWAEMRLGSLTFPETAVVMMAGTAAAAFLLGFGLGHLWNRWAKLRTAETPLPASPPNAPAVEGLAAPSLPEAGPPGRSPRRHIWALATVVAGAAIAFFSWQMYFSPLTVSVAPVQSGVREQVYGLGQVGARVQSSLGFKVAGVITELDADQSDRVHAGQVLARLDARDIEAQVAVAKANVAQARANVIKAQADVASATVTFTNDARISQRYAGLVPSGSMATEQAQDAETAMQVASANVQVAQSEVALDDAAVQSAEAQESFEEATLAEYTLSAPYDGWVISRNLELGASFNPGNSGQSVFTLVEANTVWIVSYVDETLAGRLQVGEPAEIVLRSDPAVPFPGHIARIEIQSDAVNEERVVDVAFDQIPENIHLAEQAEVFITTGQLKQAALVPQAAAMDFTHNKGMVWTLERGKIAKRSVTFGPQLLDGRLPLLSGLPEGAAVVLPQAGLRVGRAATIAGGPTK